MYARSSTFQGDPARINSGITFVRDQVMPSLQQIDGCIGVSLIVNRDSGRAIVTSAWRDEEALRDSDALVTDMREQGADIMGGRPVVEVWEIAALHRVHESGPGACVRATWSQVDPMKAERSIDNYRMVLLPLMEDLPGFCSASLLVDRASGRAVSSVTYATRDAMERSRDTAASMRRGAVEENELHILEVGEFELALAHLRVPETV
jgi:quinol monooxygenase YgiN